MLEKQIQDNIRYLELLSTHFPTIHEASTEIINLEAIMNLPKGTEHFLSDVHGEDEAFLHIVKSGSGIVRKKIDDVFGATITNNEKRKLATLVYYPKEVVGRINKSMKNDPEDQKDWYEVTLHRLVLVLREVSSKYTRSKVRKALPNEFEYIIEELLHQRDNDSDKDHYYNQVISSIIDIDRANNFIIAISEVIQQLTVDHLHLIGDIFDRGPNPDVIMDKLMSYHSLDIQWGNHDVVWMGAAAGSKICILNVIRICARYGQLDILEENYGINLLSIARFAMDHYKNVEKQFYPKTSELMHDEEFLHAQINKACSLMLFKLEEMVSDRNPIFGMEGRKMLSQVDFETNSVEIDGVLHRLMINDWGTVDPKNPVVMTEDEIQVLNKLQYSFLNNVRLQQHVAFLFDKGGIYKTYNGNLLYHGCIPLNEDGSYTEIPFDGKLYSGKQLLDHYEHVIRKAYAKRETITDERDRDFFWFLWSGSNSSLFGKNAMKTFERILIGDKSTHGEGKNPYYKYIEQEDVCKKILTDFNLDPEHGRIINGHVPVKVKKGEKPVKSGGRLIVIDGGLSKAYQDVTGIAGYTFIFNSHGMLLAAHEPFTSAEDAIANNVDMIHELSIVEHAPRRILVGDTDIGRKLARDIEDLKLLVSAYRLGFIKTLLY